MRTSLMTVAVATFATAVTLNAQTPQTPQTQQPQTQPPASRPADRQQPTTDSQRQGAGQVITIVGCLKDEKSSGGSPNVAERAGMGEDYILTNVKMSGSSNVSGMGALASRYQIEGISESELKKHLNHQVEITGTISHSGRSGSGMSGMGSGSRPGATGSGSGSTGSGSTGAGTTGSGSTGAGAGQRMGAGSGSQSDDAQEFRGTSMKMIATTCQAQQ